MRKISVCIITKNESEKLKKCLKQLMGYGFEIVVVDTGSTDDTVVMAKKYADKVCYFSWCNDFSAARNYALTLASNDIVMMIDSDEYLQEIDTGELENLLKQHPSMVGRIKRINRVSVGEQETEYIERINRIFSRQQYEYSGSIHEQVTAKNKEEYKGKWEIVFLPYKVSMWDSLESIWKRAFEDDDFDTYVVPIPYYDRNPDRTFGEYHYEGKLFPADVPITHYEDYNFAERMPDAIFIHNPYDLGNLVTSVEPKFYSNILKNYTNLLIYIPYFLFPKEPQTHLIDTFALENVDSIFVQNEEVKEAYVNQAKIVGNEKVLEKVFAVGSPKIDKICEICKDGIPVPDIWKEMSANKKKVFMNTNVSLILNNKDKFIDNLRRIFDIFKRRGDVFVIWREHPLTEATLKSMKPEIRDVYYEIRSDFVKDGLGVIDTNSEAYEAIYFSDCYFGSGGSLAPIYAVTGKPILITAYKYPDNISSQQATIEMLLKQTERSMFFSERYENFLDLFLDNIDLLTSYKEKRFEFLSKIVDSIDGTTGNKIMLQVKDMLNKERRG